jgi:BirA family transcriptional regulator, biotin operon repressor / biotin---[acetyl-CoA-carboxylase] ligase
VTGALGFPRLHLRQVDSTNLRARELASAGAPHGTLVTAHEQVAGRGRQGRAWAAPPGRTLIASLVLRDPSPLLSLAAGAAVADVAGDGALVKWPNDVLVDGRKIAGILVEGRPQERWAVLGIGLNVAVRPEDLPEELRARAGTLGRDPSELDAVLGELLDALARWTTASDAEVLNAVRARDALRDRPVRWAAGEGVGAGIDPEGRLLVRTADGATVALDAGEVHLLKQ